MIIDTSGGSNEQDDAVYLPVMGKSHTSMGILLKPSETLSPWNIPKLKQFKHLMNSNNTSKRIEEESPSPHKNHAPKYIHAPQTTRNQDSLGQKLSIDKRLIVFGGQISERSKKRPMTDMLFRE